MVYKSISSFYSSNEWTNCRMQTIMERLNEKGQTICEHCGKPITRDFDCVIHHIVELNNFNVNDYNISLNPSNLQIVHRRCHDAIHFRFGYQQRKVYIVWGSPCCGKTSYLKEVMGVNDIVLDIDSIWECITNNPRYIKPNGTWEIVRALREEMIQQIKMRTGQWHNAYILTTEGRKMARERIAESVGADEVIYIESSKEQCIERLYQDNTRTNKEEHIKYIDKFFNQLQI